MRFRAKGGGLAIAFATVASAVTLLVPAQSSAVTFGANLARAPDNTTRVGLVTGPMQVVVEQALRQDNPGDAGHPTYACCQAINASQVFTPAANAITQIAVNLPIRQDIAPDPRNGLYTDQHLALSVLAPNVPIPANIDQNGFYGGWFPAWRVGDERAGAYGGQGAVILLSADWSRCLKASKAQSSKKKKRACGKKKEEAKVRRNHDGDRA